MAAVEGGAPPHPARNSESEKPSCKSVSFFGAQLKRRHYSGRRFAIFSFLFLKLLWLSANGCAKTCFKVFEMEFSFANDVYFQGGFKQAAEVLVKLHIGSESVKKVEFLRKQDECSRDTSERSCTRGNFGFFRSDSKFHNHT